MGDFCESEVYVAKFYFNLRKHSQLTSQPFVSISIDRSRVMEHAITNQTHALSTRTSRGPCCTVLARHLANRRRWTTACRFSVPKRRSSILGSLLGGCCGGRIRECGDLQSPGILTQLRRHPMCSQAWECSLRCKIRPEPKSKAKISGSVQTQPGPSLRPKTRPRRNHRMRRCST